MGNDANSVEGEELLMPSAKNYEHLHNRLITQQGAADRLAALREETLNEIHLFKLRRALGLSQTEVAEGLDVSQSAVSQLERAGDPRVSTLRRYLARLGAELHLVAVFDTNGEEHRVEFSVGDA